MTVPEPGDAGAAAWAIAAAVRSGATSARDVLAATAARIEAVDGAVNAFTVLLPDGAERAAEAVDAARAAGRPLGPLAGVPVSIKDHVWLRDAPATNGSRALRDHVAGADCVCVARLRAAGAVIVGKTNNPEFCYRGITDNSVYGLTRNPRDATRTAGGSSGGAAASVAAGMVPLAVGTDGGGSIRIPSAFCGVAGLKPTFGLIPKQPGFRGWPTLSVTGPIAASVRDLALAAAVMAGPAAEDDLTWPGPPMDLLAAVTEPRWDALRVAASPDLGWAGLDPDVRECFESAVAAVDSVMPVVRAHPVTEHPSELWDTVALAEGWASEGPVLEAHPDLVDDDAAAIVKAGAGISARQYLDAQAARTALAASWARFFADVDVLLTPTMPVTAFEVGRLAPATLDGAPLPASFDAWCALLLPANLCGLPAVTIPCGTGRDGLPVGLQLIGPRWSEPTLLRAAALIESLLATG